jgi:hypothetical protein
LIKNYINLTNGIEAISLYDLTDYSFIRIKSTYCEQKLWDKILIELDNDLLINLALGNICNIYDFSNGSSVPRSIWQGVPLIEFVLNLCWLGKETKPIVRGHNVKRYFDFCYKNLSKRTIKKLKYFKKFLYTDRLNINCITAQTINDGDYDYYGSCLLQEVLLND